MSTPLTARIVEEHANASRALPPAGPTAARRRTALAALTASGLPTSRDENWKYANLRPLERLRFVPAAPAQPVAATDLPAAIPGFARYVFVDGAFAPALSAALNATATAVTPLCAAGDAAGTSAAPAHTPGADADERFALLNEAFATDGAAIRVAAHPEEPVRLELVFVASADAHSGASYPRLELRLESQAQLLLIERHVSAGPGASFVNSAVTVDVGAGATLHHYRLQELAVRAIVFDTLCAAVGRDACYRLHGINIGAQSARSTLAVRLTGERADLRLAVVALGEHQQVQDTYARVEHAAPRAHTEQVFRGISAGRARVAFNGKIVVGSEAHGTDSRQSLRGLLAGPEAEIDVRPQLEIYTDEVRCSHGATAGKLDENMLFYLLSRGLEPEVAQRLLKWAFLEDVVAKIGVAELRRQIEERLALQVPEPFARAESA
ncbi:MAG: Fe-S cluster assembly protein SufD [Gammaproteobacteria bacterium]|nr:MAG: Fe-S cluster assembly protein SufD [Gammaproteobacteria bacterium]TLZ41202.1 MAG: Fe-S cluster assembly protein SufD [Gammaproteobacteria bacterium]